jgi:enoyl-CoA hydratase
MPLVLVDKPRDHILLLTLNRPEKRNALSVALLAELAEILRAAEADSEVRCIVLTGDERAFSAGADIADQHERGTASALGEDRLAYWAAVETFSKPKIAAVRGFALGGGNELVLLCDFAIAGEGAIFGFPEISLGIFPGDGGTQRLSRVIGRSNALRLIMSGERIRARRAFEMGLVSELVPDEQAVSRALDIAGLIASRSPNAVRLAKETILTGSEMSLEDALLLERSNLAKLFGTEDQKEGMAAFVEKRTPAFRGH